MSPAHPPALDLVAVTAVHGTGAGARRSLASTSLSVRRGEAVAVVGRSGAGKSTLAEVVLGLRAPAGGTVEVDGEPWCSPGRRPPRARRRLVQGVPQDAASAFPPGWTLRRSIHDAVRRLAGEHGTREADAVVRRAARLAHLDERLLDRRPSEVSGGQAQRAAIARALAVRPAVLVADEPTSALDAPTALAVSQTLIDLAAESDLAVLVVTHDPGFAARCARTVTIEPPDPDADELGGPSAARRRPR